MFGLILVYIYHFNVTASDFSTMSASKFTISILSDIKVYIMHPLGFQVAATNATS
jgi:hypothetical protein